MMRNVSLPWEAVVTFLKHVRVKPIQAELETEILAWVLANSSQEHVIEEAVKALAGMEPSPHLQKTLLNSCASETLVRRFTTCFKAGLGLPTSVDDVPRTELYLFAMLRLVQPFGTPDCMNFPLQLVSLLEIGQPLRRWDGFKPCLQALACALRIGILIGSGKDEHNEQWEQTKWHLSELAAMGSKPYVRKVLVQASIQGLLLTEQNHGINLQVTCGVILGKQLQNCKL
jgi:hypothetical protein